MYVRSVESKVKKKNLGIEKRIDLFDITQEIDIFIDDFRSKSIFPLILVINKCVFTPFSFA